MTTENKEQESGIKCVFCNSIVSNVTAEEIYHTEGCETCGYGSETTGEIIVTCDKCGRVIYKKEFKHKG